VRLVDCRTHVVANPPPSFGGHWFLFVEIVTDDGVTGLGESYSGALAPALAARVIEDVFARHLEGASPFDVETFVRRARGAGFSLRPDPTIMGAVSALEMACWDVVGKAVDRPVHALLGGRVHERLRGYSYLYPEPGDATDVYADPDLAATRAAEYVARGFTAVKFDPAGPYTVFDGHQPSLADLDRTEAFLARLREAVGDRADLLLGTHGQFTAAGALRLARRIERHDPLWFEEPVPPTDEAGMARVVAGTRIPVAAGERLTTAAEFDRLLACGVAVVQPNLARAGGLLEGKKIAALAEVRGAQLAPHLYCGPVAGAANVQLACASPNFLILEGIGAWDGFHAALLRTPMRFEDGHVIPPDAPGLGVELDPEVVAAHPFEGDALHLDAQRDPV
jgi:L-alanine-DL-glutamate epimerase-like enolase superfamily enzyme